MYMQFQGLTLSPNAQAPVRTNTKCKTNWKKLPFRSITVLLQNCNKHPSQADTI